MASDRSNGGRLALRHAQEIINGRQLQLVDELYLPNAVFHDPFAANGAAQGRDEIKSFFEAIVASFPDFHFDIEDGFGTEDRGVWRGMVSGTLQAPFGPFPATGKQGKAPIAEIFRVEADRIAEVWVLTDPLSLLQQLGLIPS